MKYYLANITLLKTPYCSNSYTVYEHKLVYANTSQEARSKVLGYYEKQNDPYTEGVYVDWLDIEEPIV